MPQSVTVQRGSVSLSNLGGYTTIFTAPSGCISTRVILGGLRLQGGSLGGTNFGNTSIQINHTPSGSSYASPAWFFIRSGLGGQSIAFAEFDGAPNAYYNNSQYYPCGLAISSVGTTLNPGSSYSSWNVEVSSPAAGMRTNNLRNLWLGPSDTLSINYYSQNGLSPVTCEYFFISIAES